MYIIDECMNTNQLSKSREQSANISYLKPMAEMREMVEGRREIERKRENRERDGKFVEERRKPKSVASARATQHYNVTLTECVIRRFDVHTRNVRRVHYLRAM